MAECSKINWYTILFGALGLVIGFVLNMYANNLSNKKLLAALKDELNNYQQQTARGKATPEIELKKLQLEAQIKILEQKIK